MDPTAALALRGRGGSAMGSEEQDRMLMEYLIEIGALAPEQAGISRQQAMVDQLRGQSQVPTEARMTPRSRGGTLVTARSPLEMLAPAIGQGVASYKERGIGEQEKALKGKRLGALERFRGGSALGQTGFTARARFGNTNGGHAAILMDEFNDPYIDELLAGPRQQKPQVTANLLRKPRSVQTTSIPGTVAGQDSSYGYTPVPRCHTITGLRVAAVEACPGLRDTARCQFAAW